MESETFELLQARILIKYMPQGDKDGRDIAYLCNRQAFDKLNIERQEYDNSQFISVGDIIELEGLAYTDIRTAS